MTEKKKNKKKTETEMSLSVANEIKAWALLNIEDIFRFMLTATDEQIKERYETEKDAVEIADKYLNIATVVTALEYPLQGWSMEYSRPIMSEDKSDKGERKDYTARFYDVKG